MTVLRSSAYIARGWDGRHDNMHLRDETKGSGNIFSPLMDGRLKVPAMHYTTMYKIRVAGRRSHNIIQQHIVTITYACRHVCIIRKQEIRDAIEKFVDTILLLYFII